jgi:hypothetical protein
MPWDLFFIFERLMIGEFFVEEQSTCYTWQRSTICDANAETHTSCQEYFFPVKTPIRKVKPRAKQ